MTEHSKQSESAGLIRDWMPELEALRGIAALMVIFQHVAYFGHFSTTPLDLVRVGQWGDWALSFFFVLSGLLVTGLLLKNHEQPRYYRQFYIGRFFRIAPLYYAVTVVSIAVATVYGQPLRLWDMSLFLVFLSNLAILNYGPLLFSALLPLWAVAVEMHFYLIWPWVIRWKHSVFLPVLLFGFIGLAVVTRAVIFLNVPNGKAWNHLLMVSWLDAFAIGALLAVSAERGLLHCRNILSVSLVWALVSWPMFVLLRGPEWQRWGLRGTIETTFMTSFLLLTLALRSHWVVSRLLVNEFWVGLGKLSYGIYLLHVLVFMILLHVMTTTMTSLPFLVQVLIVVALSTGLASLCRRCIESPFRAIGRQFAGRFS